MTFNIAEPDTVLTDIALAIEGMIFIWFIRKQLIVGENKRLIWFFVILAGTVIASTLGAISHILFISPATPENRILWTGMLWALGLSSVGITNFSAEIAIQKTQVRRLLLSVSLGYLIVYTIYILGGVRDFFIGIIGYLPSVIFLLIAFIVQYRRDKKSYILYGLSSALLTFVAAAIQHFAFDLKPIHLSHNAFFHVVQAIALFLLFKYATHDEKGKGSVN